MDRKRKRTGLRIFIGIILTLIFAAGGAALYDIYGPGLVRYNISFDSAGGEPVDDITVKWHRSADLPVTERKDYTFKGWTLNGVPVTSPVSPKADITLTAQWDPNSYTVSFDSNGGQDPPALTLHTGDPLTLPASAGEIPGRRLKGWTDTSGNIVSDRTVLPCEDITLTAQWELDIEVRDGVTYVGGILIANKTYQLPSSYNPGGLTDECYDAFKKMQNAASGDGIDLWIVSGFRSYSTQESIYWRYVGNDGMAEADTYSARPGHSEHQTGLAMDLNSLDDSFANTPAGRWLEKHGHEYGFIIRYPRGKQDITGYIFEPWHVRYLGVDIATKVYESGLTLEEYLGIDSKYKIASAYEQYGRS